MVAKVGEYNTSHLGEAFFSFFNLLHDRLIIGIVFFSYRKKKQIRHLLQGDYSCLLNIFKLINSRSLYQYIIFLLGKKKNFKCALIRNIMLVTVKTFRDIIMITSLQEMQNLKFISHIRL